MTNPGDPVSGEAIPEADVVEQRTPVDPGDEDNWPAATGITGAQDRDADEADLIEQAREVPLADDDFDR